MADTHRISRILEMFDQMIFPIVIPVMPLRLEEILTRSSGAEVPNQTIVSPMIIFDMLAFFARDEAHSIRISAPFIRQMNPSINRHNVRISHIEV